MSNKSRKLSDRIVGQRISVAVQVLSIMASEAEKMSWFQRFRISWTFLWKKNIDCFFELASRNSKEKADEKV